ncbi:hypothetical protein F5Y16DRAFT_406051 [Xylariaceae sp. FL0255]|nr:hypothetical protein F5Y16DRAFT_406051 [Xylariaceae sp. FL0255]
MPPTMFSPLIPASKPHIRRDSLDTSDIIGIAVGIPSALLALIGVVIAYLTYKKPEKLQDAKKRFQWVGNWAAGDVYGGQHNMNRGQINNGTIETQNIST